jgi:hypothetical protein
MDIGITLERCRSGLGGVARATPAAATPPLGSRRHLAAVADDAPIDPRPSLDLG